MKRYVKLIAECDRLRAENETLRNQVEEKKKALVQLDEIDNHLGDACKERDTALAQLKEANEKLALQNTGDWTMKRLIKLENLES